jgi:undecaprenyl-diphosphatase
MAKFIIELALLVAAVYVIFETIKYFSYWGLGVEIVGLFIATVTVLLWLFASFFIRRKEKIKSLLTSLGRKIKSNKRWQAADLWLKRKTPRFYLFLENRLSTKKPTGLYLTWGVIVSAFFFFSFLGIIQDIIFRDPMYFADLRVIYLLRAVTSENLSRFFIFFTNLDQPIVAVAGLILAGGYLIYAGNKLAAKYLATTTLGGFLFFSLTKIIFQRPRPVGANLITLPGSYSLPSGHAVMCVCFYGFIAYLIFKKIKNKFLKTATLVLFLLLTLLIGLSRAYLGVHYPSDVLAGWFLGFTILAIGVTLMNIEKKLSAEKNPPQKINKLLLTALIILFCLVTAFSFSQIKMITPVVTTMETGEAHFVKTASLYSEDLFGQKMEPISFVVVGDEKKLLSAFAAAGWSEAEKPNLSNFLKLSSAIAKNKNYPTAPMTPAFYNSKTNDLGFEKSTDLNSARQRHHTRYWLTNYKINGESVFVATASFDQGVEIGPILQFPVHRISPDIDAEREFVMNDLLKTGLILNYQKINLVGKTKGTNAAGDNFTTDGQAYFIYLK